MSPGETASWLQSCHCKYAPSGFSLPEKELILSHIFGSQVPWLFLLELKIWNLWRQHSLDLKASIRMNTPHFLKGMTGFYAESSSANGHTANARILTLTAYGICSIKWYLLPNLGSQRPSIQYSSVKARHTVAVHQPLSQISVAALSVRRGESYSLAGTPLSDGASMDGI